MLDWARRIVGDAKAMRQDLDALKRGLEGHVRMAVIPTALPIVARLTTPFRAKHPGVRFTALSRTSIEILHLLENLEVDAGLSYLDNEPLGQVRTVPLYDERYRLLTAKHSEFAGRSSVTWLKSDVSHCAYSRQTCRTVALLIRCCAMLASCRSRPSFRIRRSFLFPT